jgi:putative transposase
MPSPKRVHRKSWDVDWQAHSLTFSCYGRQPFFSGHHAPNWFLETLGEARDAGLFDLWAYVIMPEHVHLVLLPAEGVPVRQILFRLKRPLTQRVLAWVRGTRPVFLERMADRQPDGTVTHRFWQRGGGYDRNLRSVKDINEKINYIHDNPVRRGLVAQSKDWLWSSARAWIEGGDKPLRVDWASLPTLSK